MIFQIAKKILEVGCGAGGFWETIPQKFKDFEDIYLTDFSNGMLDTAKETLGDFFKFFQAEVESIISI